MPSSTDNVKLGVCDVIFDGQNLGFTKGGVEVEVSTDTYEVKVDQFGNTPISELIIGRMVKASVPLAEVTLDNLMAIMPGSTLVTDGVRSVGTIALTLAPPVNGDTVTLDGVVFTYRTLPLLQTDMAIGATFTTAAQNLANAINNYTGGGFVNTGWTATIATATVTVTAKQRGTFGNGALSRTFTTPANGTVVQTISGVNPTRARVDVATGTNVNLLTIAKTLVLRPRGTTGSEDFIIWKSACPGALQFSYNIDSERVYKAEFKGFADAAGKLFSIGDTTAV